MGQIAGRIRRPAAVGDVVVSVAGDVVAIGPEDPDPATVPRTTRADVGEQEVTEIRVRPLLYVAAKFVDASFSTYLPDPAAPAQAKALETTKEFCRMVHKGEPAMLALIGSTGTGKSHLLYSAAKGLHAAGHRVFSRPWYLLADHLRYGGPGLYSEQRVEPEDLREAVMRQPIILIDEVRPTAGTAFDDTELAKIVCHAWDNGRAMLITTNVSPLAEVLGQPIASRFTQVTITGPDHRQS